MINNIKRSIALILLVLFIVFLVTACNQSENSRGVNGDQDSSQTALPNDAIKPTQEPTSDVPTQERITILSTLTPSPNPEELKNLDLTPFPTPALQEVGDGLTHQLVFAIQNPGRYAGENGGPDWMGWGAASFAFAPDHSVWIADITAHPDRLLQFNPQGVFVKEYPLGTSDAPFWVDDFVIGMDGIWLLDTIAFPPTVRHLDFQGQLVENFSLPGDPSLVPWGDGTYVLGVNRISLANPTELPTVILLQGYKGYFQFQPDQFKGSATFELTSLEGYPSGGKFYRQFERDFLVGDIKVNPLLFQSNHQVSNTTMAGVRKDGSFYLDLTEINNDQGLSEVPDRFIHLYSASGTFEGAAYLPPQEMSTIMYDLEMDADGRLYWMVSRLDHSLEIYRLDFTRNGDLPKASITQETRKILSPLLPDANLPEDAGDLEKARSVLLGFFYALSQRDFNNAAALYGGSYVPYQSMDITIVPTNYPYAWEQICMMMQCLAVAEILKSEQIGSDSFKFLVGFMFDTGGRFTTGLCCGMWERSHLSGLDRFTYEVIVGKVNGKFMVLNPPIFTP